MTRAVLTLTTIALACAAMPSLAVDRHYVIGTDSIAAAMSGVGMQVAPKQVTLLTDVVSTTNAPRLKVRSMEKSGDHRLMVRFECERSEECMPFYARIGFDADQGALPANTSLESRSHESAGSGGHRAAELHVGSPATLLLDSARVHVSLSVICLENGAIGQKIRVATGDRQRTFVAEVVSDKVLKGSL